MIHAPGCICGKRLFLIEPELCSWCGRGVCVVPSSGRGARLRRLPRDLGAFEREGRRPDPHLDNVVRLDRLREAWKVPPVPEPSRLDLTLGGDEWAEAA